MDLAPSQGGIFPEVIRRLAAAANFTPEYYKREDRNYGHLVDGNFTGAIRSLLDVSRESREKCTCSRCLIVVHRTFILDHFYICDQQQKHHASRNYSKIEKLQGNVVKLAQNWGTCMSS